MNTTGSPVHRYDRDQGGRAGELDIPWMREREIAWERELARPPRAKLHLTPALLEELGGEDRARAYGWKVTERKRNMVTLEKTVWGERLAAFRGLWFDLRRWLSGGDLRHEGEPLHEHDMAVRYSVR